MDERTMFELLEIYDAREALIQVQEMLIGEKYDAGSPEIHRCMNLETIWKTPDLVRSYMTVPSTTIEKHAFSLAWMTKGSDVAILC